MIIPNFNCFGFIIHTNQYSGNFEREMCAYLTGKIGECGIGKNFIEQLPIKFDNVLNIEDEGCLRPCNIYPTEGYYNNGMGFNFMPGEENEALEKFQEAWINYYENQILQIKKYQEALERGEIIQGWLKKDCEKALDNLYQEIEETKKITIDTMVRYEAYQSVIIFFETRPSKEQINLMKERAYNFTNKSESKLKSLNSMTNNKELKIIGFNIVEFNTTLKKEVV